ncbi:MAG: acyltransferase [Pseudomonadota bacterium]
MNRISRILKYIFSFIFSKINPLGYARYIGVVFGRNVNFYGMKPGMFSTEPWLITIGNDVHVTSGCQFITHDGGTLILRKRQPDLEITARINVGNDVYIGMNSMIMPGVSIGDNVIVGAGSVVTKDLPSNGVYAGVPARFIKSLDDYMDSIAKRSLGFGHLSAKDKERALKKHFGVE